MNQRIISNVAVPAFALLSTIAVAGETARYDASLGGVPHDSPCWEYATTASIPAPLNNGQAVVLGQTTNNGTSRWTQDLIPFSFNDGASIAASVQVANSSYYAVSPYRRSGYYIGLVDRLGRHAMIGISSDRILLSTGDANWSDQTYLFNSTGAFNTYKLVFAGNVATAYINGVPVLSDTVGTGSSAVSSARFGDMSILANSLTQTAWVVVEGIPDCAAGDLDCSGTVDGADLGVLLSAWGSDACAADLNHDGTVNGGDLGILLSNWG